MLDAAPGLVVVDEAYAQFADWTALDLVRRRRPLVRRAHVLQDVEHGRRPGSATPSRPAWVVAQLDKVVLPYHLDAAKQLAGTLALRHVDEMERPGQPLVAERERVAAALGRAQPRVDAFPSGANFVLFRFHRHDAGERVAGPARSRRARARLLAAGRGSTDCLRVTIGTPAEDDRFLAALRDALAVPTGAAATMGESA